MLQERALEYAAGQSLPYYLSLGKTTPTVMFPLAGELHGNFLDVSFGEIRRESAWCRRLKKPHPQKDAIPPEHRPTVREMDSSNSSDALLMNVFCHPGIGTPAMLELLGLRSWSRPEFGVEIHLIRTPQGRPTEVDMRIAPDVTVEAKLTEKSFTRKNRAIVQGYARFEEFFDPSRLPGDATEFAGYQLIRNVLVAATTSGRLFAIVHADRPDLVQEWEDVMAGIRDPALRARCRLITWQQIAAATPDDLRAFLSKKYGIA